MVWTAEDLLGALSGLPEKFRKAGASEAEVEEVAEQIVMIDGFYRSLNRALQKARFQNEVAEDIVVEWFPPGREDVWPVEAVERWYARPGDKVERLRRFHEARPNAGHYLPQGGVEPDDERAK